MSRTNSFSTASSRVGGAHPGLNVIVSGYVLQRKGVGVFLGLGFQARPHAGGGIRPTPSGHRFTKDFQNAFLFLWNCILEIRWRRGENGFHPTSDVGIFEHAAGCIDDLAAGRNAGSSYAHLAAIIDAHECRKCGRKDTDDDERHSDLHVFFRRTGLKYTVSTPRTRDRLCRSDWQRGRLFQREPALVALVTRKTFRVPSE